MAEKIMSVLTAIMLLIIFIPVMIIATVFYIIMVIGTFIHDIFNINEEL